MARQGSGRGSPDPVVATGDESHPPLDTGKTVNRLSHPAILA